MSQPLYAAGLAFSCTRCSACCRHESGFVFLSETDLSRLAAAVQMDYTVFVQTWCRWVPSGQDRERLSLREQANYDCVFWDLERQGCAVYHARPLQCRAFPFWESVVCSAGAWEAAGRDCPGINSGALHGRDAIEGWLRRRDAEPVIERRGPPVRGF